jgi:hypothetical protein
LRRKFMGLSDLPKLWDGSRGGECHHRPCDGRIGPEDVRPRQGPPPMDACELATIGRGAFRSRVKHRCKPVWTRRK